MIGRLVKTLLNLHLTVWIFVAMFLGILVGILFPKFSTDYLGLLSNSIFLPMIKACIVPLVFSTLVTGIAGHGDDTGRVGRMAWKSLVYFMSLTLIALFIGLAIVNIINPGIGVTLDGTSFNADHKEEISLKSELNKIFQPSFYQAAVGFNPTTGKPAGNGGEILAIVFMAVMFAIAIMHTKHKSAKTFMLDFNKSLSEIMFTVVNMVMQFAPFGIFGAMASAIGHSGISILVSLGKLIGSLYLGLLVFVLIILIPLMLFTGIPVVKFFSSLLDPLLIAFATASSDAALPKAMENMIEFGVPPHIVGFVIPTGYTFNLVGTTLYLAVASVYCAQASGLNMSLGQQVYMMLILLLTSKGVAAVPRASLVVLSATCEQFGLNTAAIFLILGVDEIMDMARTAINVTGNCLAAAHIAQWEGDYPARDDQDSIDLPDQEKKDTVLNVTP